MYINGLEEQDFCTGGVKVITNNVITHYEKEKGFKSNFYNVYLEQQSNSSDSKDGEKKSHSLFIAVPTEKELPFKTGDLIVIGKCSVRFDETSERASSESYRKLRTEHKVYTISSIEPCLIGNKRMWHYELGCD